VSGEFGEVNKRSRGGVVMVGWVDGCGCGWRSEPVSQPCCSTVTYMYRTGKVSPPLYRSLSLPILSSVSCNTAMIKESEASSLVCCSFVAYRPSSLSLLHYGRSSSGLWRGKK